MFKRIFQNKAVKITVKVGKIIALICVLIVFSIILIQRISNNNFSVFGIRIYTVVTESMEPVFNVSDMLLAKEVSPNTLKVGDDIVYLGKEGEFTDKMITHRIVDIESVDGQLIFTTKGVANPINDPEITADQIYGKIIYQSALFSFFSKLLNNIYTFYFMVFVPIVIFIFFEVVDEVNYRKKKREGLIQ